MLLKIISSSLCQLTVCSNKSKSATLTWVNQTQKVPVKNREWKVVEPPTSAKCNCRENKIRGNEEFYHYVFSCLFIKQFE